METIRHNTKELNSSLQVLHTGTWCQGIPLAAYSTSLYVLKPEAEENHEPEKKLENPQITAQDRRESKHTTRRGSSNNKTSKKMENPLRYQNIDLDPKVQAAKAATLAPMTQRWLIESGREEPWMVDGVLQSVRTAENEGYRPASAAEVSIAYGTSSSSGHQRTIGH